MSQEETGIVSIHGKDYQTVAKRVTEFREQHEKWCIKTKVIANGQFVSVKASIYDEEGRLIANGHAEEERGHGINATSAVENCETSAVGRALAFYRYPGTFLRSADEMSDALIQQGVKQVQKQFGQRMSVIRDILPQILELKAQLADENYHAAVEIIHSLTEAQVDALNLAPTKGGILTTEEVNKLKSNEYAEARNSMTGYEPAA